MRQLVLLGMIALFCIASSGYAQQGQGTILGTVTDTTGSVVPGVTVTITNTETNARFTTKTNDVGFYTAPALPVSQYTVSAEREGFNKVVRAGITLQVDQRAQIDLQLQAGGMVESINVVATAPALDTSSASLGKVVENRRPRPRVCLTGLTILIKARKKPSSCRSCRSKLLRQWDLRFLLVDGPASRQRVKKEQKGRGFDGFKPRGRR